MMSDKEVVHGTNPAKLSAKALSHRVVAVASVKGGIGKSSCSLLLARSLACSGYKVLLIDADPQASITSYLLPDEDPSITAKSCGYHLLTERLDLMDVVRVDVVVPGLDLVPAARVMSKVEGELAGDPGAVLGFRERIMAGDHDVIIMDCPPALGTIFRAALYAASLVIAPVQPDAWAMTGLDLLSAEVTRVRKHTGRFLDILAVPSICSPADAERVRVMLPPDVVASETVIPKNASVRRAFLRGSLPSSVVTNAIDALALEVLK